ncbi:MAG: hypothetical protein AAFY41_07415, partial [Bacteroidota bacterium]
MNKILILLTICPTLIFSQSKKILDHNAYDQWRRVSKQIISNDGKYIVYTTEPNGIGNKQLKLHSFDGNMVLEYEGASNPYFTNNSKYLIFRISPDLFELRDLKRKKTKEKNLPGDTLAIYSIETKRVTKIAGLKSFKVPEKWDDYVVYLYEPE